MLIMKREEALELLKKYNKEDFHILHGKTLECVMGYFADLLGYGEEKDFWQAVDFYMIWTMRCGLRTIVKRRKSC